MQEILLCGDRSYFWTGFGASGEREPLFCLWDSCGEALTRLRDGVTARFIVRSR
ncbi:hypothetical protein [Nostoc sp.]|uniref:hypothetical protein n=1 Tax=Nostoc sp. TaxID=1180 RepID=UPI0026A5EC24